MTTAGTPREKELAWAGTVISCGYYVWCAVMTPRHLGVFASLFEGLGADMPISTGLLIRHGKWFLPLLFGATIVGLLAKELRMQDKRLSLMITLLVAIVLIFFVDSLKVVLYRPLFDLIGKLS